MTTSSSKKPAEYPLKPYEFERIRSTLATYSGVYIDQTSQRVMALGLAQRLEATGKPFDEYASYINQMSGLAELHALAELVLNHETVFFRNQPHMQALREVIFRTLHRRKPAGEPIRVWSAGCSTGEEPYSIAITAMEALGKPLPRPVQIWATDLSESALEKARHGIYRGRTLSNVSPDLRQRYFDQRSDMWSVNKLVRELITFEQFNLLHPFPKQAQAVDIIFCQNVTIYFELETFRDLVDRFYHILPEGGYLFLGFSETLWNIYDKFRLQEIASGFIYVKEPPRPQAEPEPVPTAAKSPLATQPRPQPRPVGSSPSSRSSKVSTRRKPLAPAAPVQQPSSFSHDHTLQRGQELLDVGQVDEVLNMLYKVPLNGVHAPKTLALIAQAHANRGDLDVAVAEARRAIALNSLTTEAYILLGVLHARQGQYQAAASQLERARYLEPDIALISFHLAEVYRQMQRKAAAVREYRNTLKKLAEYAPEMLLDGVSVGLLQQTCERYIRLLREA